MDPSAGYLLSGTMLEIYERAPFWSANGGRRSDGASLATWLVDEGQIAGVSVSGLTVVTLTVGAAELGAGRCGRLILLEEDAHPEQVRWLVDALHGRLGGPLAVAARLVHEELGFYQVPINYRFRQQSIMVDVPRMLRVVASGLDLDPPEAPADHACCRLRPDWSGEASEAVIDVPDRRLRGNLSGCPALRGSFRFQA